MTLCPVNYAGKYDVMLSGYADMCTDEQFPLLPATEVKVHPTED